MASPVGVHERHGHFRARIGVDGTNYKLGDWSTEEEAARAYDSAARYYRDESEGRNGTGAPPRPAEELRRLAHRARSGARGDTSAYRGVHTTDDRPGWGARIGIGEETYFLGRYSDEEQAARAYDMAIRQYRPGGPTNFEGEKARTVAELRRRAHRLKSEEPFGKDTPTSGYRGVCWDPRREKWLASIGVGEETEYLGGFDEEIEAAKAYDRAALRYHDPANTNFPPSNYDVEEGEELPGGP